MRTATATPSRCRRPKSLRRSCAASRSPGIMWCCWAPEASRNGPTRCLANWRSWMGETRGMNIAALAPNLRGRLTADAPLAPFTWFRVGGPAEVLFSPTDEDDLAYLLSRLPVEVPVTVLGLGSNLIVRDGGVSGVVIRLGGRAFGAIETTGDHSVVAGAAAIDAQVARAAGEAGIDGLAFLRGVPGSLGGALRMNAGAHGGETREVFVEARGIDRAGAKCAFGPAEMGFSYRHSQAPADVIFTRAVFQGRRGDPQAIKAEMERITAAREASQPIRDKT